MAISIDRASKIITVPKADLTPVTGTLYDHDTDAFRKELLSLDAASGGITHLRTHRHNTEVTVAGVTYARTIEIINGYRVQYEDGAYSVRLIGSNNNIFDVQNGILVQNQVQVIPTNSAGLQTVSTGSGLSPDQDSKLSAINAWVDMLYKRMDLDELNPNKYWDDRSKITGAFGSLDKTDNGDGTHTVKRTP